MASNPSETNVLLKVASISMVVCRRHMSDYSHPKSPHKFTQSQLMSCLVLKSHQNTTYRGVVQLLEVSDELRAALGLEKERLPRFNTLKTFADRAASAELLDGIVGQVLALCQENGVEVSEIAGDSTGVECSPASRHYELRIGRQRGRYVKLMIIVSCTSILAVSASASMGPSNDTGDAWGVLWKASGRCRPQNAYFDAGFDSERIHRFFDAGLHTTSYIPPVIRSADGSINTPHRARCKQLPARYGRRKHVESFISGLKRICGSSVRARLEPAMQREAMLKVLAYAIRR